MERVQSAAPDPMHVSIHWIDDTVADVTLRQGSPTRIKHRYPRLVVGLLLLRWGLGPDVTCHSRLVGGREFGGLVREFTSIGEAYLREIGQVKADKLLTEGANDG